MMEVDRKALKAAVGAVTKAAMRERIGIPALSGVLMEVGKGRVRLTATDLETSIRTFTRIDSGESWTALVPAKLLKAAVASGKATVTISKDGGDVLLGDMRARTFPVEDFPTINDAPEPFAWLHAGAYAENLAAVVMAASDDEARPVLTGVFHRFDENEVELAATDSYRLHTARMAARMAASVKMLIPAENLRPMLAILGKHPEGEVAVAYDPRTGAAFTLPDGTEVRTRSIEGEFPNYQQLVPSPEDKAIITFDHTAMLGALSDARTFLKAAYRDHVVLTLNSHVSVTAEDRDIGTFHREVPGTYTGQALEIGFRPDLLSDAIVATGASKGYVWDPNKPALFTERNRTALVMPYRLQPIMS